MPTRNDRIHADLDRAEQAGRIDGWQTSCPGDGSRRWSIAGIRGDLAGSRTFSTREVEAFLAGIAAAG